MKFDGSAVLQKWFQFCGCRLHFAIILIFWLQKVRLMFKNINVQRKRLNLILNIWDFGRIGFVKTVQKSFEICKFCLWQVFLKNLFAILILFAFSYFNEVFSVRCKRISALISVTSVSFEREKQYCM